MRAQLTEDYLVEQAAIDWLKELSYFYIHGSELSPENGERESYRDVILKRRFAESVKRLNPWLNERQLEEAYKKIRDLEHPDLIVKSELFYQMLVNGVKITLKEGKEERTRIARIFDFDHPEANDFLASNQFTVEYQYEKGQYRRPDLVIFVNGIPLAVFEFKSFNQDETGKDAFYDHKAKIKDIPQLYAYTQILVASDGYETKYGSIASDWDRFFVWEGIFDDNDLNKEDNYYIFKLTQEPMTSLEVLLRGLFRKEHLSEYFQDFIVYEKAGEVSTKKIAMFHQFYAVRKAVERTKKAILDGKTPEERRIGIVWHTQGSGKSLTMLLYAKKVLKIRELENPLLLFVTDRRDLDEQLYGAFASLPIVKQAESIRDLQEIIKTAAGGIVFATIQKFSKRKDEDYPFLTDRNNIVVIADEAHRSQYRELAMSLRKAITRASFMGFTATPIELEDRSTTLVFGDYISIYPMDRARRHGVIVPVYYEARLSELHLTNEFIDEEFEEISEFMEPEVKEALKRKYARLEQLISTEERLEKIAKDIVEHFNKRVQEFEGKAMVVTISRKVAVKLYEKIKNQAKAPSVVVVMSGNKQRDPEEFWPHIRDKHDLEELANNFKNPEADPQMAIVVDMWLTGFDVPCLHTMYFDKPMKNHPLVHAIGRVNRVFKDKPGGLIVDYLGIADDLRKSLTIYTLDTINEIFLDINEIINQMKEKHDIISSTFHGIDYEGWKGFSSSKLSRITTMAYDRICKDEETKKKFIRNFIALKKLYALASPRPEAIEIKDEIRFFEMIKKMVVKYSPTRIRDISRDLEYEISHLISKSITAGEPVDLFALMKEEKPEISILDENFLAKFRDMQYRNYAAELLAKILRDQLIVKIKINPFRYRSLYDMLKKITEEYNVKLITTVEVIEKLIELAKEIRKTTEKGKELNLTEEELAFYDLLSKSENFFLDYEQIEEVAREVVKELGYFIKVADWNRKEHIKARIRTSLKRVLMKAINGRANYEDIEQLSLDIINHAEAVYALV